MAAGVAVGGIVGGTGVAVAVAVGGTGVSVAVAVAVAVGILVGVRVGDGVLVGVALAARQSNRNPPATCVHVQVYDPVCARAADGRSTVTIAMTISA